MNKDLFATDYSGRDVFNLGYKEYRSPMIKFEIIILAGEVTGKYEYLNESGGITSGTFVPSIETEKDEIRLTELPFATTGERQ